MIDYPAKKGGSSIARINLTSEQYELLARDGNLRIKFEDGGHFDRAFALTNLKRVTAELEKCTAGLRALWAMSPEEKAKITSWAKPKGAMDNWFTSGDYPRQAAAEHNTGTVGVRLMIDDLGVVKQCVPVESSGSAVLDAMACYVFEHRGKFTPATDKSGKPMRSFIAQKVHWVLD